MYKIEDSIYLRNFAHPKEQEATELLDNNLIGKEFCEQLIEMYKLFEEETLLPDLIGKTLEVNDEQFPELYTIFKNIADKLSMVVPKIYIFEGRYCDVNAEGLDTPWIQITTKMLEDFDEEELKFAIARQLVHIKLGHMRYEILCEQFSKSIGIASQLGGSMVNFIPGGSVASQEAFEVYAARFKLISSQWSRIAEYTADRCALMICDWNIKAAITAISKQVMNSSKLVEKMKIGSFVKQADAILELETAVAKYSIFDEQFPYGPFRIKELISFASLRSGK